MIDIVDSYFGNIPKGKYFPIWQQYVPAIVDAIDKCKPCQIMVPRQLFEKVGNRKSTGYDFTLEYVDCEVTCTLKSLRQNAVKRDLDTALYMNERFCTLLMFRNVSFWFHDFILHIDVS